jgi:hypothetical protein
MKTTTASNHGDGDTYLKSKQATDSLLVSIQSVVHHYTSVTSDKTSMESPSPSSSLQESTRHILTLKQSQRSLGLKLGSDLSEQLSKKRRQVENQALLLQNILYERNHLLKEIRSCKRLECPNLLKMAKDELEIDAPTPDTDADADADADADNDTDMNTHTSPDDESDAIINRFLAPPSLKTSKGTNYSHRDPARHSYNLSKMHSELTTRGTLHNKLLKAKKGKSVLLEELTKKRKFLTCLPEKILELEKGVEALRGYFDNEEINPSQELMNVGIGDLERGQKARELSAPLYTLFVQFGSFIQAHPGAGKDANANADLNCQEWKLKVVPVDQETSLDTVGNGGGEHDVPMETEQLTSTTRSAGTEHEIKQIMNNLLQKEEKALQLQIPTSTTSKDLITIQFEYLSELKIITAHVVQDKILDSLWLGKESLLLMNLFLGDTGKDLPLGSSSGIVYRDNTPVDTAEEIESVNMEQIVEDQDQGESTNVAVSLKQMALWKIRQSFYNDTKKGKPYDWCQYLAGLNYPKPQLDEEDELLKRSQIEISTKVVLLALYRRFRSHATLGALVRKLGKNRPNPIPYHPSLSTDDDSARDVLTKLVTFEENNAPDSTNANLTSDCGGKVYCATIKRKQKSIKICVKIDARYPSVPPLWSLHPSSSVSNQVQASVGGKRTKFAEGHSSTLSGMGSDNLPLYDSTLGIIESRVNSLEDSSMYVKDEVEESYDWIIMHQLRRIIVEWDTYQKTLEEEEGGIATSNAQWNMGRSRRGRDRCPTALYALYKHGL